MINFTLVYKVFFTLKSPSEFNFKKYFDILLEEYLIVIAFQSFKSGSIGVPVLRKHLIRVHNTRI